MYLGRLFFLAIVGSTACVGDTAVPTDSGAKDATPSDAGGDVTTCTPSCTNATTFHDCVAQSDVACALGCVSTGTPHCAVMQPASPVTPADLTATGVSDLVISKLTTLHTDTGAIDGIRTANVDPTAHEVISQIGFQLFAGANVGVFTMKNFTVNDTIVVVARGGPALAVVAGDTISLLGTLDARGYRTDGSLCGGSTPSAIGPGGSAGGISAGNDAVGAGGGHGADVGGGGGGGFGGTGGDGRKYTGEQAPSSVGGATVPFALPISGGFGGGANGAGDGGGGGGAVQLVAANAIKIGGGTKAGGVNVGGCGGFGATNSTFPNTGGGGGGSGGEILLQSPAVTMLANGVLAANGGAGGDGGGFGTAGLFSDQPALPAPSSTSLGGAGAAGSSLNGVSVTTGTMTQGAGGGGGVGRIRIDNAAGTITLPGGAILSPSMGTNAMTTVKVTAN
jgi:hypothetical protein